jgi:hypothetical protein
LSHNVGAWDELQILVGRRLVGALCASLAAIEHRSGAIRRLAKSPI